MSVPQQQPNKKAALASLLALLVGFVMGCMASNVMGFISSLGPEYNSATTIREITQFVQQNETWPTSWTDLSTEPLDGVRVNWTLQIGTCDRYDVMTSVSPTTDSFYTYPHAERELGDLWQLVSKIQKKQFDNAVNQSGRERGS